MDGLHPHVLPAAEKRQDLNHLRRRTSDAGRTTPIGADRANVMPPYVKLVGPSQLSHAYKK